ncbi:hypothetical protein PRUPE_8G235200 [Prunus persica]|uniref:Uncharacterized protein n=1 Tax=Prunus persica TaxID=3760 RepID=M5W4B9_PRUPE|nr:hypothetical protein PRUPE_8G235200 [Prunus persica]
MSIWTYFNNLIHTQFTPEKKKLGVLFHSPKKDQNFLFLASESYKQSMFLFELRCFLVNNKISLPSSTQCTKADKIRKDQTPTDSLHKISTRNVVEQSHHSPPKPLIKCQNPHKQTSEMEKGERDPLQLWLEFAGPLSQITSSELQRHGARPATK